MERQVTIMKKRLFLLTALALCVGFAAVATGQMGTAYATASAQRHVIVTRQYAGATFEKQNRTTVTSVYVDTAIDMSHGPGEQKMQRSTWVDLTYEQHDLASGAVLQRYYGEARQVDLRFGPQMRWATLDATVPVKDTRGHSFTVSLHITWQATGPVQRDTTTSAHEQSRGIYRQATALGTLNGKALPTVAFADLVFTRYAGSSDS